MAKNTEAYHVGCVVLAAGTSTRFGGNKLKAELDGKPILRHALEAVPPACFSAVTVVVQSDWAASLAEAFGFTACYNPHPEDGLSSSIRLGLDQLRHCDGILFQVADQPLLRQDSVLRLVHAFLEHPDRITALSHDGTRGNPCLFPKSFFPALYALTGDVGGSVIVRKHPEQVLLVEAAEQELTDVDTQEALDGLKKTEQ